MKDAEGNDLEDLERYCYDKAGNMLKKTVNGKTTTFAFDGANQLVSSTCDGVTTKYAYDAAGRLVREGNRTYRYGYLDKVLSVTEGDRKFSYAYHVDGQLAEADYGGRSETFEWDGLALARRGDESFINEPHAGGGNPVCSTKGVSWFNDMLGTTLGAKKGRKYSAAALTAFGEGESDHTFYTGKPQVEGLGHVFLFRNYRAGLAKWQTADPMGYPDGWNQLAYCGNSPWNEVDLFGAVWGNIDFVDYYFNQDPARSNNIDTNQMGLTDAVHPVIREGAIDIIDSMVQNIITVINTNSGSDSSQVNDKSYSVACGSIVWAMGNGTGYITGQINFNWWMSCFGYVGHLYEKKMYAWRFEGTLTYYDSFKDPADVLNLIGKDIEIPFGSPYDYGHVWNNQFLNNEGYFWARMIE